MLHRFYVALVAVLVSFAGCADGADLPLTPDSAGSAVFGTETVDLSRVLKFASTPDLSLPRHAEKFIRASEGGVVELNGFRVEIPAGALPADTTVTIDLPRDSDLAKHVIAELGPHGIQFNKPVTLAFPLEGVALTGGSVAISRWENGAWTTLSTTRSADGKSVRAATPHFSTYAETDCCQSKDVMAGG